MFMPKKGLMKPMVGKYPTVKMKVNRDGNIVVMSFDKLIDFLAMPPEQAMQLSNSLRKHALEIQHRREIGLKREN